MKFLILLLTSVAAFGQIARPTYNPFNNGMMMNNGFQNNAFRFPNNTNHPMNFNRPTNNGFQNNGFQNNGFQNNGFQNNGFQSNGFQNNGLNNLQQQNNNFQQQGNNQTNSPQMFTRRFHLNNGYLFGRPTLYLDPKTGKMQPWVRKNLR